MIDCQQKLHTGYGCEDVAPRGFVSLMDLYEQNYIRLRRLIPELADLPDNAISHLAGHLSLHLTVLERTAYTTTLYLTYYFEEPDKSVAEPAITLRLYHDAHQAEVLTGHLLHGRQHYRRLSSGAVKSTGSSKWKLNRFLYKWLGYCLYLGHSFQSKHRVSADLMPVDNGYQQRPVSSQFSSENRQTKQNVLPLSSSHKK